MEVKVFVVYDSKAEAYDIPFMRRYTADAIREWSDLANGVSQKDNVISRFAADYTLFEIGTFNQRDGVFTMYESKRNLGTALEHVRNEGGVK